jgi:hypothetical protein
MKENIIFKKNQQRRTFALPPLLVGQSKRWLKAILEQRMLASPARPNP